MQLRPQQGLAVEQAQRLIQSLSPRQRELFNHWRDRLSPNKSWKSMLSKAYRLGNIPIKKEEAQRNDEQFGRFVDYYMNPIVKGWLKTRPPTYRIHPDRIVHVGVGTGLGMDYLKLAANHEAAIEVYDWCPRALGYAEKALRSTIRKNGLDEHSVLRLGEASQVCSSLDTSVVILQIIRVIEHMPEEDAARALQGAGQILMNPRSCVVIGDAMKDEWNDRKDRETCTHYPETFYLDNLRIGAKRPLEWESRRRMHRDIEKVFTFLTIRAKR
jgi:hypothetical protein